MSILVITPRLPRARTRNTHAPHHAVPHHTASSPPPQSYVRFALDFSALTYNSNTVNRRALLSATTLGGSVFILVAGSLATKYKAAAADLQASHCRDGDLPPIMPLRRARRRRRTHARVSSRDVARFHAIYLSMQGIQESYRATGASKARASELEAAAASAASENDEGMLDSDMARSEMQDGTVGASTVGRIGFRLD